MPGQNFYEAIIILIIFCAIQVLVFITQFVLLIKFKKINNNKLSEIEDRIRDSEKLVSSQVNVNNEVVKMINSINKLVGKNSTIGQTLK